MNTVSLQQTPIQENAIGSIPRDVYDKLRLRGELNENVPDFYAGFRYDFERDQVYFDFGTGFREPIYFETEDDARAFANAEGWTIYNEDTQLDVAGLAFVDQLKEDFLAVTGESLEVTYQGDDNAFEIQFNGEYRYVPVSSEDDFSTVVAAIERELADYMDSNTRITLNFDYNEDTGLYTVTDSETGQTAEVSREEAIAIFYREIPASEHPDRVFFSEYNADDIQAILDTIFADGDITAEEIRNNPPLERLIVEGLGYASVERFVRYFDADGEGNFNAVNFENLSASLRGLVDGNYNVAVHVSDYPDVDIPADATFITIITDNGPITFDGPDVAERAGAFLLAYNESPLFAAEFDHLIEESPTGRFAVHQTHGPWGGANPGGARQEFFVTENQYNGTGPTIQLLVHEGAHDFHYGHHEDESGIDTGLSHSREQSIFHGAIFNELAAAGHDFGFHADKDDYSADILVLSGPDAGNNVRDMDIVGGPADADLERDYAAFQDAIQRGDYRAAYDIMKRYEGAEVTITFRNPQYKESDTTRDYDVTYNVQELMFQELLVNGDSEDWLNTDSPNVSKDNIALFFELVYQDTEMNASFMNAVDSLYMDLSRDFLGVAFYIQTSGVLANFFGGGFGSNLSSQYV